MGVHCLHPTKLSYFYYCLRENPFIATTFFIKDEGRLARLDLEKEDRSPWETVGKLWIGLLVSNPGTPKIPSLCAYDDEITGNFWRPRNPFEKSFAAWITVSLRI